jgi:DMSO reductase anchor subunit
MNTTWAWPVAECLHFSGLVLLVATVGLFDLRVLGVGKGLTPLALHGLVPYGVAGLGISLLTGLAFISTTPDQYFYNPSFHLKVIFLGIAALNLLYFYSRPFRAIKALGPFDRAPLEARICAGVSLFAMTGIMLFGRMLTFFRPPARGIFF